MAVKRKYEKVKNEGKVARKVKPSLLKLKKNMDIESAVAQYSICIPTSAIDNCFNLEQTTFTAYQIAKTAVLFNIQEIIVLDLSKDRRHGKRPRSKETISDCLLLATLLQYFVTPSNLLDITFKRKNMLYLKHAFAFPKLHQLAFMNESAEHIYREGLSIAQDNAEKEIERDQTNLVYIGKGEIIELSNQNIPRTVRVTVDLQRKEVVSPRDVYKNQTLGYHVRVASTLDEVSEGYARTLWVNSGDYHYDEELSKYRKVETKLPYIMKIKKGSVSETPCNILLIFGKWDHLKRCFKRSDLECSALHRYFSGQLHFPGTVPQGKLAIQDGLQIALTMLQHWTT
ncbi:putative methyltransferase SKDI_07G5310 [Saccharomyces kudriavzevii IFO 1802]|uniref:Uncharacterized protein n=2 Tax=Saccharomyces kudriavzevii (strain ATCC MYA-4449 / AS 2.2408 / CBS 8840 / NBRC 1802 / NCYC 2889) TaxID=226230 RepID=A0AA35JIZ0_SACK1|nr:uncharacterized protein SKDI_07G5310 [Saccharomyces kudriavzevii IFO 1802]EJT42732.1 YGR283C-like protein [Saccharomyces kudriavzevii IFO 1802]CAI4063097.1 hypothetical protein SKDI_07G5310 [Saccharomyces kudriavzevii IFO 1802]